MVGRTLDNFIRSNYPTRLTKRVPGYVVIDGTSSNLSELEDNIFDSIGIRVVIRMGSTLEVFSDVEKHLTGKLTLNNTIGEFRSMLKSLLRDSRCIGKRGAVRIKEYNIAMGDIVVIRSDGREAPGQTILKNAVWRNV